jgi:hypothetical protein
MADSDGISMETSHEKKNNFHPTIFNNPLDLWRILWYNIQDKKYAFPIWG